MIERETVGEVTILRMARGKGNSLDLEFAAALIDGFYQLSSSDTKAVVLTGKGNVFGAGVDLKALVSGGPAYVARFLPMLSLCLETMATFPKPLVAAVNGHAIAGGAIAMLACDQRIGARGASQIGLSEVRVGVLFPAWPLEIARFSTPPEHFQTLIGTGRTWGPEEALTRGLLDELVDASVLIDRALEVARELAQVPGETFRQTKFAVRRPLFEAARQQAKLTDEVVIKHWSSPEVLKHVADFAARAIKGPSRSE